MSSNALTVNGDISSGHGQFGNTIQIVTAANLVHKPPIDFDRYYNNYIIFPTAAIDFTLAPISSADDDVPYGHNINLVNIGNFPITVKNNVGTTVVVLSENGAMVKLMTILSTGNWQNILFNDQLNSSRISQGAVLQVYTLPTTCEAGTIIKIVGDGSGGWQIAQNAGQTINSSTASTTTGVGGTLSSTNRYDSVELVCTIIDTNFTVANFSGVLAYV